MGRFEVNDRVIFRDPKENTILRGTIKEKKIFFDDIRFNILCDEAKDLYFNIKSIYIIRKIPDQSNAYKRTKYDSPMRCPKCGIQFTIRNDDIRMSNPVIRCGVELYERTCRSCGNHFWYRNTCKKEVDEKMIRPVFTDSQFNALCLRPELLYLNKKEEAKPMKKEKRSVGLLMSYKGYYLREVKEVIFNDRATIINWKDGGKTVTICKEDEALDKRLGFLLAVIKGTMDSKSYDSVLKAIDAFYIAEAEEEVIKDARNNLFYDLDHSDKVLHPGNFDFIFHESGLDWNKVDEDFKNGGAAWKMSDSKHRHVTGEALHLLDRIGFKLLRVRSEASKADVMRHAELAMRHFMVCVDAKKYNLDINKSREFNKIDKLLEKYPVKKG